MNRSRWLAPLAAVCILAPGHTQTVEARRLIRPGEGIGPITLGMNAREVHDAMELVKARSILNTPEGKPAGWRDEKAGAIIEAYSVDPIGKDRYSGTLKVFYVKNRVAQVAVDSRLYTTTKGASARLTSTEFRKFHTSLRPGSVTDSWGGRVRAYDSPRLGLAVTYTVIQGNVETRTAQEIMVHLPGQDVILESPRAPRDTPPPAPPPSGTN